MNNTGQWKRITGKTQSGRSIDMKPSDQIRRHVPSPAPSEDGKALTPHEIKRRAQNRASQRAFRERKRNQAETLQHQVHEMQQRHDELLRSYHHKEEEVSALYERIRDLEYKIQMLKTHTPSPQPLASSASSRFEPVVFDDPVDRWSATLFQTPVEWNPPSQQTEQYFDGHSVPVDEMSMDFTGSNI